RGGSVLGRRVHGEEEERGGAGIADVVVRPGGDRDQRAAARAVLSPVDPHQSLPLDHVDDLIAAVLLGGARIDAGRDRHHRALRSRCLLEHAEELAPVGQDRLDLCPVLGRHRISTPFCHSTSPSHTSWPATKTARPCCRPCRTWVRYCQTAPTAASAVKSVPSYLARS